MAFIVRDAVVADIPAIMRLKRALAIAEDIVHTLQATAADWERDAFGPNRHFVIFVAIAADQMIGIAICAERHFPGWVGPTVVLHDLYVDPGMRRRGFGTLLLARVAAFAKARGSVMVELMMRAGNPAGALYEGLGFIEVIEARNYVIAGTALDSLAAPTSKHAHRAE